MSGGILSSKTVPRKVAWRVINRHGRPASAIRYRLRHLPQQGAITATDQANLAAQVVLFDGVANRTWQGRSGGTVAAHFFGAVVSIGMDEAVHGRSDATAFRSPRP